MEIFHCPFSDCAFNQKKNFKKRILLDQHLLNRHSEKRYKCPNCLKQYAIEWQLKYHLKGCGLVWTCLTCNKTYKERLSLITHCKRNSHQVPENAKLLKKESQKNLLILPCLDNYSIKRKESKFRPILPKSINISTINQIDHLNKSNLLEHNTLIDNSCQTDNLCQCPQTNLNNQPIKKIANTLNSSVQCPEISEINNNYSNLRRDIKSSTQIQNHKLLEYSDSHTQTDYSSFIQNNQLFKDQSTSTDINSDNFLNLKRKSVATETNLNNLNKNYCFFNLDQQNLLNSSQLNSQFNECNKFKNNFNCNLFDNQLTELTELKDISSELNKVQLNENTNEDPLLSTISVQTDFDYDNLNDYLLNNDLDIQFTDIQTQTYFTDFNHNNATQTEDFSLDIDNIFDN